MTDKGREMNLEELLGKAYNLIDKLNEKARIPETLEIWWIELSYNFETSLLSELGKKQEWVASLLVGTSRDDVRLMNNFFGKTATSATQKLLTHLKKLK